MPKDFEIKIVTSADLAAAQQAAGVLKQAAAAGGEDTKAAEAGAKATSFLSLKKADLKKVVGELAREFPLAGQAARLMLNPITAGITLAIGAFGVLKRAIGDFDAALTTSQWEDYGSVVAAQRGAFQEAAQGAAAFKRELDGILKATESASAASERLVTVFKAQQSAQEKVDAARQALELARAAGDKDPVARQARVLEIEERYAARGRARAEATTRFELEQQRQKLANEQAAVAALGKGVETARAKQAALESEAEVTRRLAVEKTRLAQTEADVAKIQEAVDRLELRGEKRWPWEEAQLAGLMPQLESGRAVLARQRDYVGKLEGRAPGQIEAWRGAGETVTNLEGMQRGAAQRARGIAAMLPTQERVAGIESGARAEAGALESASRATAVVNSGQAAAQRMAETLMRQIESRAAMDNQLAAGLVRQGDYNEAVVAWLRRLEGAIANARNR